MYIGFHAMLQSISSGFYAVFQSNASGVALTLAPVPLLELPVDLQRHVLGWVPLREVAQLACLNSELRSVYLDRVKHRDAVLGSLLECHFTPDFREGLSHTRMGCALMALPRDLIVTPSVWPLVCALA
jgi:hypothetical protein